MRNDGQPAVAGAGDVRSGQYRRLERALFALGDRLARNPSHALQGAHNVISKRRSIAYAFQISLGRRSSVLKCPDLCCGVLRRRCRRLRLQIVDPRARQPGRFAFRSGHLCGRSLRAAIANDLA